MEGICEDTSRLVVSTMVSIQKAIEFIAKRSMRIAVLVGRRDIATSKGTDYMKTGNQNLVVNLPQQAHSATHNNLIF